MQFTAPDRGFFGKLLWMSQAPLAPAPLAGGGEFRTRMYYGWVLVLALGVTETVSYGILSYAFPVFLAPMESELGWTRTELTGAFSLAALVSGAAAIPVGRWIDRHGPRGVMTAGSLLATVLLLSWSRVDTLWSFYAVWVGLGVAAAAVLYEPAFAVVANWFVRHRGRALTLLTFMGGFASVIFVPLATGLVTTHGWRSALVWLAVVLAVLTIPPHALLLRRSPAEMGLLPDGDVCPRVPVARRLASERSVPADQAVRSGSFRWLAVAFGFSALVTTGMAVHLIPLLLERGYSATFAGAAMGMVGLMALPGRLIFTPLGSRWPRGVVAAVIFLMQAVSVVALLLDLGPAGVWVFAALFGAGFGAITPARAALVAEWYGPAAYGSISGVLALVLSVARAAAPVGASLVYVRGEGYGMVLMVTLVVCVASAAAVLRAGAFERAQALSVALR